MLLNSANLQNLNVSFQSHFQNGLNGAAGSHEMVATTVPSLTAENSYPFLGEMPGIREFISERFIHKLEQHGYAIKNKDYELTISVKANAIADDQYGIYAPMFQAMGYEVKVFPSSLAYGLLAAGFATECYDGQYFFDTDHQGYDENGDEVSISNLQAGANNPWFLVDDRRPLKPIIYQEREHFKFVAMDDPTDENVFKKKEFLYGVDGRMNVGFAFWQIALGSKADLTADNFNDALVQMASQHKRSGAPLGIRPTKLLCGASNRAAALEVVKAERNAEGATNINRDAVEVVVVDWLK